MTDRDDHSGAVTLPPLIFLAACLAGLGLDAVWPVSMPAPVVRSWVAAALVLVGVCFTGATVLVFWRHRTTIHVHRATTALVTDGPFRLSRNPVYVSLVFFYVAFALFADQPWMLVTMAPALIVLHYGVIAREEAYLDRLFGDVYRDYRQRVRRWL